MTTTKIGKIGKTVHIIPLGFEYVRAIAPFTDLHPEKAILVVPRRDPARDTPDQFQQEQDAFTRKVKEHLESRAIAVEIETANTFELNEFIRTLSSLIRREKQAGNTVLINTSSSGRFASMAAAFAGMAHNIPVYYVRATGFANDEATRRESGVSICDLDHPEVDVIPNFQILLPKDNEAIVLEYLYVLKTELGKPWASPTMIGRILNGAYPEQYPWQPLDEDVKPKKRYTRDGSEHSYETYRKQQTNFIIRFQKTMAHDLEEKKYIVKKDGEKKHVFYEITETGKYALYLYGISGNIVVDGDTVVYRRQA